MSAVIKFIDEVLQWRTDYKPEWRQAHIDKWNKYLALIIPVEYSDLREKYNIPKYQSAMNIKDLEVKSKLNERWNRAYQMYMAMKSDGDQIMFTIPVANDPEFYDIEADQKDTEFEITKPSAVEDDDLVKDLENRISNLESKVDTVHETATMALEVADKVDTVVTEQLEDDVEYEVKMAEYNVDAKDDSNLLHNDRNPNYNIPQEIKPEDAREMADILIKYGYIEDWGRDYTKIINSKTYREYQRVKLMGGYEPHESAPDWFKNIFSTLKRYWMEKGKQHWQNMVTHIKHNTDGSHLRYYGKGIEDMPYGTFRNITNSLQKDKFGKVSTEFIPYDSHKKKVLDYRREQIKLYRYGEINEINWKPPFHYVVIKSDAEDDDFWDDERRIEFRKIREEEAKKFD